MHGRATALGAGTVLNALATATGSAFAIDAETTASVELDDSGAVRGSIAEAPDADTRLIERCVELVVEAFGDGEGGTVETESDLPMAAGLKSSSAAANATVLATLSALGRSVGPGPDADISRLDACRMGVRAAREVGVTATGAFDDASASMVGGVVVTDNTEDELIVRDEVDWDVLVWTPPERAYSADADVSRCENVAPMADLVADLALEGRYAEAMTVNGLAFSAALDFPTDPAVEAMPIADGVSLSGTGPSVVAVGDRADLERVRELWDARDGETRLTTTRTDGARIQ
ncbi:shikimate kinase [Haloferax sp. Atlit-10N]|uniref:Shikimate kinase n=1 Tax=Haloferax prahovense (strain DSM 18310 / JCM 13924 / TL6) TaxID=1227461 RepID=M0GHM5_HALPT|nr:MULTISPECIES: shikimate kinase [Haloferax]ELZ71761.1 shikimate kinase [Haloferax prahovense DSM 18310]RDZ45679.1 shikimate kinase [Haloferax sp. Atlit-19N]RDZ47049.1 shikimate kinase [Haloferax sp. Atlit-16N]RDZ60880.1 shikimate kinase [Haloferax sp. Atlit-10N]REA05082.1 shikimate kinase [Haloferax sp. Atlit-6N]